jgi:hypothetical protein
MEFIFSFGKKATSFLVKNIERLAAFVCVLMGDKFSQNVEDIHLYLQYVMLENVEWQKFL